MQPTMPWSLRNTCRYAVVLFAGIFAGSRAVSAYAAWRQWREWRDRDPSGAEASLTFAQVDLAVAVLCLGIGWLIWWLLRPRSGEAPDGKTVL
jgi:hypothetical protein